MDQLKSEGLLLQFEPPGTAAPSLQQQVQQLLNQRGALRHITKQSIEAELGQSHTANKLHREGDEDAEVKHETHGETLQASQEKLWKAREDMLQKLAYAQNEILSALDFVSLLLSGNSVAAQSSMSPALKQHVPAGTLERHAVEKQDTSVANKQKLARVSQGWKSESFKSASSKLSQAADRLESEAQRQTKYWNQIAYLKTQGWSTSRLPTDNRAVGIHFGFAEAAPQFRNRGFALLQQDESGGVQLDRRSIPEHYTTTRITVVRNGIETGSSRIQSLGRESGDDISEQIGKVRDAIFEEELFHEVNREARLIANQGVSTQPNAVEANVDTQTQIRIVRIGIDEPHLTQSSGPDDQLADAIALNIRLLLLLEHTKSKERRSRPPSIMSLKPQTLPEYALLRPILAHLRHQASLSALQSFCKSLEMTCAKASLHFDYHVVELPKPGKATDMQCLRQPARSLLSAQLANGRKIEMEVETYLGSPIYGTVFRGKNLDFGFVHFPASSFSTVDEAVKYLAHAITLELMSQTPQFEITRPHSGEVTLNAAQKVTAIVSVRPQVISLLIVSPRKMVFSWRQSGFQRIPGGESNELKSFKDVVGVIHSTA